MIDSSVAQSLLSTAQALRLLGCDVALSGISAPIAMVLTSLDFNLEGVTVVRGPQDALMRFRAADRH